MSATDRAGLALLDHAVDVECWECLAPPGSPCSGGVAHRARLDVLLGRQQDHDRREAEGSTFASRWREALAKEWPTPRSQRIFPEPSAEDLEWQRKMDAKSTSSATKRKRKAKAK